MVERTRGSATITMALVLLCAGLAALAWTEWTRAPAPVGGAGDVASTTAVQAEPLGDARLAFSPLEDYEEIVRRPLFNETRAPREASADDDTVGPSVAGGELGQLTLTGVVISGDKLIALIRDGRAGRVHRLERGSSLGEWRLEKVDKQSVTLRNAEGERQLTLYRNKTPAASTRGAPDRGTRSEQRR